MSGIFTTGQAVSLVITTPSGNLTIPNITDFTADPVFTELKSRPLGGSSIYDVIPDGWDITFKADRTGPALDNFFAAAEAGYFNNQSSQYIVAVYETIREPDGSVSQWRYPNVALKMTKGGDFSGDKKTEQSFAGKTGRKIKVS